MGRDLGCRVLWGEMCGHRVWVGIGAVGIEGKGQDKLSEVLSLRCGVGFVVVGWGGVGCGRVGAVRCVAVNRDCVGWGGAERSGSERIGVGHGRVG